jgi:hypothetical protein
LSLFYRLWLWNCGKNKKNASPHGGIGRRATFRV